MCCSFDRRIEPGRNPGLTIDTYTYFTELESSSAGLVQLNIESRQAGTRTLLRLTPAEARAQAQHLLDAAAQVEADCIAVAQGDASAPQHPESLGGGGRSYEVAADGMREVAYATASHPTTKQAGGAA